MRDQQTSELASQRQRALAPVSCSADRPETVQLHCPKCGAMRYNVHASDLAKDNGDVTCSSCGHVRVIKTFSAAKLRTSPSETVGRSASEGALASPPKNQSETAGVARRQNNQAHPQPVAAAVERRKDKQNE